MSNPRSASLDQAELTVFWRQLGLILRGGLPLPQALLAIGRDAGSAGFRRIAETLRERVEDGEALSDALARSPRQFDAASVACIRAGERSGDLAGAAGVLAAYGEKTELMRGRGRVVLTYPLITLTITVVVGWVLQTMASPLWITIHKGYGARESWAWHAPAIFRAFTISLSGLVVAVLVLLVAYRFPRAFPRVCRWVDGVLLRLPGWRAYYRSLLLARFTRMLTLLLRSGVPLPEALELAGRSAGNRVLEAEALGSVAAIRDGAKVGASLKPGLALSPATVWAIRVAEERGDLEETLACLADYHDEAAALGGNTFLTVAEPLAIAVVGLIAAATIVALAFPLLDTFRVVGH